MEIIRELEGQPRGVYCGAIGYVSPGREAVFSVAIRTVVVNAATQTAEIGIGSGITWDSEAETEYEECLVKGRFLTRDVEDFSLIESIRHDSQGYLLLERHLRRLALSAGYFGIPCDLATVQAKLTELGNRLRGLHKVRILVASDGRFTVEAQALADSNAHEPATVAISDRHVSPEDPFLYHKSTNRQLYDHERKKHPHCYDVIFFNSRGELCEGSYNNIVLSLGGTLVTPALKCGLLPGVLREELLEVGAIKEAILTVADLHSAKKIWLVNSVRGWRECTIEIDNA
jgi:para-aminobenzoate synthetase/4-amino-4-deoxychorismate lyase